MTYPIPLWLALLGMSFAATIAAIAMGLVCSRRRDAEPSDIGHGATLRENGDGTFTLLLPPNAWGKHGTRD